MLSKGSSVSWPEQLKELTKTDKMDIGPLKEYFAPLIQFLDKEMEGEKLGWDAKGMIHYTISSWRFSHLIFHQTVEDYFDSTDTRSINPEITNGQSFFHENSISLAIDFKTEEE